MTLNSKKMQKNQLLKYISLTLVAILVLNFCVVKTLYSKSKTAQAITNNIPSHLTSKGKKVGFILNHFELIKDFDQKSISSIDVQYGKGSSSFLAKVTVTNNKNQNLVYQVSTDPKYYWNYAWGYHGRIFYKLYEYYPNTTYINPVTKSFVRLLKSISYYDAYGRPGTLEEEPNDIYRREFVILNKNDLIKKLKIFDVHHYKKPEKPGSSLVLEVQYNTQRKLIQRKTIKNSRYWTDLNFL